MKGFVILLAAATLSGCMGVQATLNYPTLHTEYFKDGFTVQDGPTTFRYDAVKNRAVLCFRQDLTFVDEQNDGRVNAVQMGKSEYYRGETGTDALFRTADRRFRDTADYMSVGHFMGKWEAMSPAEIMARWRETRHKP